jgi:transcriptional regulator with GAF, ATPase, and Fis domain
LDEIDDLSPQAQASLLRVLQERQVVPIGEAKPIPVDIRLCSATNRRLSETVASKKIREDLFARISGFTIRLPPLRERREDFGLILGSLLRRYEKGAASHLAFDPKAARALLRYDWPLNIRELEKCIELAVVLAKDGTIGLQHLSDPLKAAEIQVRPEPVRKTAAPRQPINDERLRDQIIQLMTDNHGNLRGVARALGKDRTQLRRWLKRFQIDPQVFKKPI